MRNALLIGILASNQKAKTLRCLESLRTSIYRGFDVLLVDNGSQEGIADAARGFDFVTASVQNTNTGCAGGRNIILDHFEHHGDWSYLLLLDNDAIVSHHAIETLIEAAHDLERKDVRLGALGPHVAYLDRTDTFWCAGGALINWNRCWFRDSGQGRPVTDQAFESPRSLDTLTGGFMMATREAISTAGRFVDDYFIYVEDTDWCWRMKQAGYALFSEPGAMVFHDASSSVGSRSPRFHYYRTRNRLWFFQAFSPLGRRHVLRTVFQSVSRNVIRMEFRSGRPRAAIGAFRGLLRGLCVPGSILANAQDPGHDDGKHNCDAKS